MSYTVKGSVGGWVGRWDGTCALKNLRVKAVGVQATWVGGWVGGWVSGWVNDSHLSGWVGE